jgi:hypothetical protein
MPATDCPHRSTADTGRVCFHLLECPDPEQVDHYKRFTGRGREYDLLCVECRKEPDSADTALRLVCMACFQHLEEAAWWDGTVGQPEILVRPSGLSFDHEVVRIAGVESEALLDIQPVSASNQSLWVALVASGDLLRLDLTRCTATTVAQLPESSFSLDALVALHVDRRGELAAMAHRRGQDGMVLDLRSGALTMPLKRGAYHNEQSDFSLAFFDHDGRPLLAHATDWNRLDISDPATGRLLTERSHATPLTSESTPEHYSGYFHGALAVSPDQEWMADNGWVWAPAGIPVSWSLQRWAEENVWESEDGPSKRFLCQRWYFWGGPWCWVGNRTLALWGYGEDEEELIPAAWLFDVESGEEIGWFAGPTGDFVFDRYLFSLSQSDGTAVWDVATGERLLVDQSLRATRYHHGTKQFLTLLPDSAFQLSRLTE